MPVMPLETLKQRMLDLTAFFETGQSVPLCYGIVSGNHDGAGMSWGALQYNFGLVEANDTLTPIWRRMIAAYPTEIRNCFSNQADHDWWKNLITTGAWSAKKSFGETISNATNKHKIVEPWNSNFSGMGIMPEGQYEQMESAEWYYDQATLWKAEFELFTRRGFALMFDIAVQSGSMPDAVKTLIKADFAAINKNQTPEEIEEAKLIIIANRRADAVSIANQPAYRERKLAIAQGGAYVASYGATIDLNDYELTLEPAFQSDVPIPPPTPEVIEPSTQGKQIFCYDRTEKLVCVLGNESLSMCPYYDAFMKEVLNGQFTFSFDVPYDHADAKLIAQDGYVIVKDVTDYFQLFCVTRIEDNHGAYATRTVFCEQASVELIDEVLENLTLSVQTTAYEALTNILNGTRWMVGNVNDATKILTVMEFKNIDRKTALSEFRKRFQGDITYRTEIIGTTFYRYVDFESIKGVFTGRRFEYARDIQEITREIDTSQIKTAIIGVGGKPDQNSASIDFRNVVWTTPADPIDKPSGYNYVADSAALAKWGRIAADGTTRRHLWGFHNSDTTDPEQLLYESYTLLMANNTAKIRYNVKVIDLAKLLGTNSEQLRMGDSVNIIDRDLAIQIEARILERQININEPERSTVVLGQYTQSLSDTINQSPTGEIPPLPDMSGYLKEGDEIDTAWLVGIIDTLRNQVNAGGGTVTITDTDGILVVDPINPNKAIMLKGGILAIANSKVNEEYQWTTFGTGDGFTANVINAGIIRTNLITIQSANDVNFFWNQALLKAVNPKNSAQMVALGKLGTDQYGLGFTTNGGASWNLYLDHTGLHANQFHIDVNGNATFSGNIAAGASISAGTTISAGVSLDAPIITGGQITGTNIRASNSIYIGDPATSDGKYLYWSNAASIRSGGVSLPILSVSTWRWDMTEVDVMNLGRNETTVNCLGTWNFNGANVNGLVARFG